mgnify:CR=1 FL=1
MSAGNAASNPGDTDTYNPVKGTQYTKPKPKFVPPSIAILKGLTEGVTKMAKESNLKRRKKFLDKKGITLEGDMSDEYISSKKGLAELKASGYTTASDVVNNKNDNDNNNQPAEPVIVQKNVGGKTVQTTEAKVAEDKKEATQYDERVTKKKGRSKNILTSKQGVMKTSADYSLGKKSLLGQVV